MGRSANISILPADLAAFSAAGDRFSGAGGGMLLILAAVLAIVAVAMAMLLSARIKRSAAATVTARLFDDLCRAHSLSDEERALLARAAAGEPHTSIAFVDCRLLDRLGESHPDQSAACLRLRERLFGA